MWALFPARAEAETGAIGDMVQRGVQDGGVAGTTGLMCGLSVEHGGDESAGIADGERSVTCGCWVCGV